MKERELKLKIHELKKKLKLYKDHVLGNKDYQKFVIICDSRTGSTLLLNSLGFHPSIEVEGEIFKRVQMADIAELTWQKVFRPRKQQVKQVGFKLFYFHGRDSQNTVWNKLQNDKEIKVIHLIRENLLRSFLSKKIGLQTGQWTENVNNNDNIDLEDRRVKLDSKECEEFFERTLAYQEEIDLFFRSHSVILVSYEKLIKNLKGEVNRVFSELGVHSFFRQSELKKQNPESFKELIINYDELRKYFDQTKWEKFFKEN